ncbi:hypothetical protein Fmac_015993 [Flemingia macrophylla]|uniref:Uncharacterized protein n=1 Tax=Flemingia macrophylla TaxID=520843 RepID=A0ABD1MG55_9FABA
MDLHGLGQQTVESSQGEGKRLHLYGSSCVGSSYAREVSRSLLCGIVSQCSSRRWRSLKSSSSTFCTMFIVLLHLCFN